MYITFSVRRLRESVSGDGRDDEFKVEICRQRVRVNEHGDDLVELPEGSGPAVQ